VSETATPAPTLDTGLLARIAGIVIAPYATYEAVARRPRALGVLMVVLLVTVVAQGGFLATEVGQQAALDRQRRAMDAFGFDVPDEVVQQMEERMSFGLIGGGSGTYRDAFAGVAHSGVILAVSSLFTMPLSYAVGEFADASLGVFFPMLEETFAGYLLAAIDFFLVWWVVVLGIGLGVYYRRRTGPVIASLLGVYLGIALLIAFWRS
jgi:hypothetical protein